MAGKVKLYSLLKRVHIANYNSTAEDYKTALMDVGSLVYRLWCEGSLDVYAKFAKIAPEELLKIIGKKGINK